MCCPHLWQMGLFLAFMREKTACDSRLHSFSVLLTPSKQFLHLKGSTHLSGTVLSEQEPYVTESYLVSITMAKKANGLRHRIIHHP